MLFIGRILGGLAGGICSVVAPSYVGRFITTMKCFETIHVGLNHSCFNGTASLLGEIVIPSLKGALGFSFQLMVVLGILVTSLFGLGLDWRLISAIMIVFPVISIVSMIYIPESPYFLVKKGKSFYSVVSPSIRR